MRTSTLRSASRAPTWRWASSPSSSRHAAPHPRPRTLARHPAAPAPSCCPAAPLLPLAPLTPRSPRSPRCATAGDLLRGHRRGSAAGWRCGWLLLLSRRMHHAAALGLAFAAAARERHEQLSF
eukprot:scaffold3367_cov52-Phaeocystis_antarctica.AAC.1